MTTNHLAYGAPAFGQVLHNAKAEHGPRAEPAEQAERWRMLQRGEREELAARVGFELGRPEPPPASDQERYRTVTTPAGRTYAAQPWPE